MIKRLSKKVVLMIGCVILLAGCSNSLEKAMEEAQNLLDTGQYQKAVEQYEALIEEYPEEETVYSGMARALKGLGNLQEAAETLEKGKEFSDNPIDLSKEVASLYEQLEDYEKALPLYLHILEEEDSEEIMIHTAVAYAKLGESQKAQELINRITPENLENPETLGLLMHYYLGESRLEEAADIAKIGQRIDEKNHGFLSVIQIMEGWPNYYLIDMKTADYTGDDRQESAFLLSDAPQNSHASELLLLITESDTGKVMDRYQGAIGGYPWALTVHDFTGNSAAEILMAAHSGGSGGGIFYNLISFEGAEMKELKRPAPTLNHRFKDNYRAVISSPEVGESYSFKLNNSQHYEDVGAYFQGVVIDPIMNGFARSFRLNPYFSDHEGRYGLEYVAPLVAGPALADEVADVHLYFLWKDTGWQAVAMEVKPYHGEAEKIPYDSLETSEADGNLMQLLGKSLKEILESYGNPVDTGWWRGDYYSFDGFTVVVDDRNNVGMVMVDEWMGVSRGDHVSSVKEILGTPTIEEVDDMDFYEHYLIYEIGDRYVVHFNADIYSGEIYSILMMLD